MSRPGPLAAPSRLAALMLVVVVGLGVGCARTAPAPTQAEYLARADEVCEGADEKLDELQRDYDVSRVEAASETGTSEDQRPDRWVRARVVPAYQKMDQTLRSIQPPDDEGSYLADLYDDLSRRIEELRLSPGRGRDSIREDLALRKRFATYGMKVCGRV